MNLSFQKLDPPECHAYGTAEDGVGRPQVRRRNSVSFGTPLLEVDGVLDTVASSNEAFPPQAKVTEVSADKCRVNGERCGVGFNEDAVKNDDSSGCRSRVIP